MVGEFVGQTFRLAQLRKRKASERSGLQRDLSGNLTSMDLKCVFHDFIALLEIISVNKTDPSAFQARSRRVHSVREIIQQ